MSVRLYVDIQCATLTAYHHALYIVWRFRGADIQSVTIYNAITGLPKKPEEYVDPKVQLLLDNLVEKPPLAD